MAMGLFKDSNYDKDHVPRPYDVPVAGTDISTIQWTPYPRPNGIKRACLDVFFNEQLNLAEICDDINHLMNVNGDMLRIDYQLWQEAERQAERLSQWHDRLPSSLDLKDGPPHFVNLQYGPTAFINKQVTDAVAGHIIIMH